MYTKEDVFEQLKNMGVPQDSPVTIHSSLKSIGEIEGSGEGLLDILIEYVTKDGGLLCVPTHTHANLYRDDIITLDLLNPETNVGAFAMIAARDKRGVRSINPSHSMMIFGDRAAAEAFASCDNDIKSCTSPDGCYGELYRQDGYVILAGVGHNTNTFLHCVEEMLKLKGRLSSDYIDTTVRFLDGRIKHFPIKTYVAWMTETGNTSAKFPKYEPAFKYHGCINDGKLGDAATQVCSAKGMADVMRLIYERSGGIDFLLDDSPEIDGKYYKCK